MKFIVKPGLRGGVSPLFRFKKPLIRSLGRRPESEIELRVELKLVLFHFKPE